jgi:hypothetical protein
MEIVVATEVRMKKHDSVRGSGFDGQVLLQDDAPDGLNFVFRRSQGARQGDGAYRAPRHCHTFQQVKFAEKGDQNFAPGQDIPEGCVAYFPRGAYYGPLTKKPGISSSIQFGLGLGAHQKGKAWEALRPEALKRLKARGTVENNIYTDVDPETGELRRRDWVQAIYEEQYQMRTQRKLTFRPRTYEAPVLMNPEAFAYYEIAHGVEIKQLGCFFDDPGPNGDTRISMIRLSNGGTYRLEADRAQAVRTVSPGLQIDRRNYPALTHVYSPRGESASMSGLENVEVYLVEFPRPD